MKSKQIRVFVIVIMLFTFACSPLKNRTIGGSKRLYKTFYVGEEGTQYFVRPLGFRNTEGQELVMDFTFRFIDKYTAQDSVTINFSIPTFLVKKSEHENFVLEYDGGAKQTTGVRKLYKDREITRFTSKLSLVDLDAFFQAESAEVVFGKNYRFHARKSILKKMRKIRLDIFED